MSNLVASRHRHLVMWHHIMFYQFTSLLRWDHHIVIWTYHVTSRDRKWLKSHHDWGHIMMCLIPHHITSIVHHTNASQTMMEKMITLHPTSRLNTRSLHHASQQCITSWSMRKITLHHDHNNSHHIMIESEIICITTMITTMHRISSWWVQDHITHHVR